MSLCKSRIGLLTLFFDLYLPAYRELYDREVVFARQLAARLGEFAEVTFPGVCSDRAAVDRAVSLFDQDEVDLIVVVMLTYTPSLYALPALQRTTRPVLLFNTQMMYALSEQTQPSDPDENHGMHGVQDLANVLRRAGRPFQIVTGHWQDEQALAEVRAWCEAARVRRELRQARVGLLGYPMESMGDFGLDETAFLTQMGVHVHHLPMQLVGRLAAAAPPSDVEAQMDFDRAHFSLAPNVTPAQHEAASRLEWALRRVLEERELIGLASHFMAIGDEGALDTLPFLAASKLLGEGYGFGGEGDVTSAVAVWLLNRLVGAADFTEMFTMDLGGGTVLMSHMGEGNWRLARQDYPVELVCAPFDMIPLRHDPVSLSFGLRPGPVTVVSLTTGEGGRLRLVITEGEIADIPPIPALKGIYSRFRPGQPLPQFLTRYSEEGGSHHQGLAYGHLATTVAKLARLMGVEHVIV